MPLPDIIINVGDSLTCAETGKTFTAARDGCSFNYARDSGGAILSDEGVNIRQRRDLSHRAGPFTCYLSDTGGTVTGWKGNVLGSVERSTVARSPFGGTITYVRVRDVHGGEWHGRGAGRGMVLTIRPCKD